MPQNISVLKDERKKAQTSRQFYFTIKTGRGIEVTLQNINIQCLDLPVTY